MTNPFIDTVLSATVVLHPSQLNNNIYANIKMNLLRALEGMCYLDYGYINKIHEILERDTGTMVPEDVSASVRYKVTFSCNICKPIDKTQIYAVVNQPSEVFISLLRGPIHVIITHDRINSEKFYIGVGGVIMIKQNSMPLIPGTKVKTTILTKIFIHKDIKILAMGTLDDIANDAEIAEFNDQESTGINK